MSEIGSDWRAVDGVATAWFDTASLAEGAALARRTLEVSDLALFDLRATGVRVRLESGESAVGVSAAAAELGLRAAPTLLQQLGVVLEATDPSTVSRWWQPVLGYSSGVDGGLVDPLQRDLSVRIGGASKPRPLRNRIHLDVVRPAASVAAVSPGEGSGPYGLRHADGDGNEVDLVPGDPLGDGSGTADWQVVFGAMACYRVRSASHQLELAAAAAAMADTAGFPLLIDLRPGLVILDTGKDQADSDAHGLDLDFTRLADRLQAVARELGAEADDALPRLVQLFLDAADVDAVQAFWLAALGYDRDRRDGVSDIHDPRRLGPVLVFQQIDTSETERRQQRNRLHIELAVPADAAATRLATALNAGGRLLEESPDRWLLADPEGNELVIVSGS